jgi:sialate O-acetylesterase
MKKFLIFTAMIAAALSVSIAGQENAKPQTLRMAGVFSDHCVLQRDMPLPIWGWAETGAKVDAEFAGRKASTTADASGRWQVNLDPLPAGGPYTLKVTAGAEKLEVADVLVGEVWIGVGQSNMIMGIGSSEGGGEAIQRMKNYPNLRMGGAHVEGKGNEKPALDIKKVAWGAPSSGSSAVSFYFAERLYNHFEGKVPVGILNFGVIAPAEAWCDAELLKKIPSVAHLASYQIFPHMSGQLFNGVIKPLAPFALRGALYYQGEMNGGRGVQFRVLMTAVIESWREAWHRPDLPFFFVQLAAFQEHRKPGDAKLDMRPEILAKLNASGQQHGFPFVRESQLLTAKAVPGAGMAVAIDVGDAWDIHPRDKKTVGDRLFLLARSKAYGEKDIPCTGPMARSAVFEKGQVLVQFDLEKGTRLTAKSDPLVGFELAGADQLFHPAEARIDGDKVIVRSKDVPEPVMLHYAWAGFPQVGLYDNTGLPASPFRFYDYSRLMALSDTAVISLGTEDVLKTKETPGWELGGEAKIVEAKDGKPAVELKGKGNSAFRNSLQLDLFYTWNADPLLRDFIRPGCVAGFSFEIATLEDRPASVYVRPAYNHQAGGIEAWGAAIFAESNSPDFKRIHVARIMQSPKAEGVTLGLLLASMAAKGGEPCVPVLVRGLSTFRILRPLLDVSSTHPVDLGVVAAGQTPESKPIVFSNGQKSTMPENLSAQAEPVQVATVLHGLADVPQDACGILQTVLKQREGIGATLVGQGFELLGKNVTADGMGVKFLGADGRPGLTGGANPEQETVAVRFKGSSTPGAYEAVLRVVTQAANRGCLSHADKGEPPVNLSYIDIPVRVKVK